MSIMCKNSIIGRKVTFEFPVSAKETKKGTGTIVDKVRVSQPLQEGGIMTYDNYLVEQEDGETSLIYPAYIKFPNEKS